MTKELEFEFGKVTVRKIGLDQYDTVLSAVEAIFATNKDLIADSPNDDQLMLNAPTIVRKSLPEVKIILTTVTDISLENAATLSLEELLNIGEAAWEVNNFASVYERVKKIFAGAVQKPQVETPKEENPA